MSSSIENIVKALGAKRFGDHNAQIDWILAARYASPKKLYSSL